MHVGALVFARHAIAGDIWRSDGSRVALEGATVVGARRELLTPKPCKERRRVNPHYDRQVRLFGDRGQNILARARVAIVGLGGAGSLLAEFIGRLGVGEFIIIDPDRVERTNLPRLVGARRSDAALSRPKTSLAERNIRRANPKAAVRAIRSDIVAPHVANQLVDCDFIFLAADTARARNVFNAVVHQYLIPGVQVGAKVVPDKAGNVADVYAVARLVTPESGCLQCSGFIDAAKLQEESMSKEERNAQRYVENEGVVAPSVITLNASAAAQAANDFMFYMTGLAKHNASQGYIYFRPARRACKQEEPLRKTNCLDCSQESLSRLGRGDGHHLPVKLPRRGAGSWEALVGGLVLELAVDLLVPRQADDIGVGHRVFERVDQGEHVLLGNVLRAQPNQQRTIDILPTRERGIAQQRAFAIAEPDDGRWGLAAYAVPNIEEHLERREPARLALRHAARPQCARPAPTPAAASQLRPEHAFASLPAAPAVVQLCANAPDITTHPRTWWQLLAGVSPQPFAFWPCATFAVVALPPLVAARVAQ